MGFLEFGEGVSMDVWDTMALLEQGVKEAAPLAQGALGVATKALVLCYNFVLITLLV